MRLLIICVLAFQLTLSFASNALNQNCQSLSFQQKQDYQTVIQMAHELLKGSFNAGGSYPEVWIRDFNTFIDMAMDVANDSSKVEDTLLGFFQWQNNQTGEIPDGYIPASDDGWTSLPGKHWSNEQCASVAEFNASALASMANYTGDLIDFCKKLCEDFSDCNALSKKDDVCLLLSCDVQDGCPKITDDSYVAFVSTSLNLDKSLCYPHEYQPCSDTRVVCKNTIETDQETSLLQAVSQYVNRYNKTDFLLRQVHGVPVIKRMENALLYLENFKTAKGMKLITGATSYDWGDCQVEDGWILYNNLTHEAIDIYDNAMYVLALRAYSDMLKKLSPTNFAFASLVKSKWQYWDQMANDVASETRKLLWNEEAQMFLPHYYLHGSPFAEDFDETDIYYHGGTAVACQANILTQTEIRTAYERMDKNIRDAGLLFNGKVTIGLTLWPPYPTGATEKGIRAWDYQNGGDWTWFGGRMVQVLTEHGFVTEAQEAVRPMVDRVLKHDGFFEWWDLNGNSKGSNNFRGSAGVLGRALKVLLSKNTACTDETAQIA